MEYDIADVVGRIWIWLIIGLLFCEVIEGAGNRSYLVSGSSSKSHIDKLPSFRVDRSGLLRGRNLCRIFQCRLDSMLIISN